MRAQEILGDVGLWSAPGAVADSTERFPDGAQYRVEIPSVEGPEALAAALAAADRLGVPVHRISQGSGIMLQTDDEIREMVATGRSRGTEVCLFTGPRAVYDVGVQMTARSGRVAFGALRGAEQLAFGLEDIVHGCDLGLRSVLVSDLGLLKVVGQARDRGHLPADLVIKVSIQLPVANGATAQVCEDLGASTLNIPADLSLAAIASIRRAVAIPLDVYVETSEDYGGTARYYEIPDLVRVAAPVHLKFGLKNAPALYPSGGHLRAAAVDSAAERVRRARIGLDLLHRYAPDAVTTPWPAAPPAPAGS